MDQKNEDENKDSKKKVMMQQTRLKWKLEHGERNANVWLEPVHENQEKIKENRNKKEFEWGLGLGLGKSLKDIMPLLKGIFTF